MKINMKGKGLLYINYFEKQDDKFIKVDEIMTKISKRNLEKSLEEDKENGINHIIEYVNEKPVKFQFGVIYILKTPKGRPDYIYTNQING